MFSPSFTAALGHDYHRKNTTSYCLTYERLTAICKHAIVL